jgi:hypothetical protein
VGDDPLGAGAASASSSAGRGQATGWAHPQPDEGREAQRLWQLCSERTAVFAAHPSDLARA